MNNATPEDYLREEAINDFEQWKVATKFQPSTGCWIAGHWGIYGITRLIEIAQDYGFEIDDNDESAVWAYRNNVEEFQDEQTGEFHNASDWILSQGGLADDAEDWLQENIASEGYYFGWSNSEFFYMDIDWWSEED